MTFSLALVTPHYALVANDTRRRLYSASGGLLGYKDTMQKVLPLDGAWLTGGNDDVLAPWLARYHLHGRAIRDPETFRRLAALEVESAPGHCEVLWLVQRDADGFAIYAIDLAARDVTRAVTFSMDGALPFTDGDPEKERRCQERLGAFSATYVPSLPLPELLRRLGALYRDVRGICGSQGAVSVEVDFGILLPDANGGVLQRRLGPHPAERVAAASDEELERLLLPVEGVVARAEAGVRVTGQPILYQVSLNLSDDGIVKATIGTTGRSVRVATSLSANPSAATTRAQAPQVVPLVDGKVVPLIIPALATLNLEQTLYVSVLAYAGTIGNGSESSLGQAQITFTYLVSRIGSHVNVAPPWR